MASSAGDWYRTVPAFGCAGASCAAAGHKYEKQNDDAFVTMPPCWSNLAEPLAIPAPLR